MLSVILLAFGFGTGFNPPLDIHAPSIEDIKEIYEEAVKEHLDSQNEREED